MTPGDETLCAIAAWAEGKLYNQKAYTCASVYAGQEFLPSPSPTPSLTTPQSTLSIIRNTCARAAPAGERDHFAGSLFQIFQMFSHFQYL